MPETAQKKGLSQEVLKLIACVSMLLDHIGAVLLPNQLWLRVIGRMAFPIYCFLLAEGVHYTHHPGRYALRLSVGMLLAEYPFDMVLHGGWTWRNQSVMVTLLLAFLMAMGMKRVRRLWAQILLVVIFAAAAELLRTDYGALGICIAALFLITRQMPGRIWIQTVMLCLLSAVSAGFLQMLCALAMLPIALYSGRKAVHSKAVQWAFYLFYPVHLGVLAWIVGVLR